MVKFSNGIFIYLLQFVNFTDIMSRNRSREQREAAFALAALMEIPFQYQAALSLKLLKYCLLEKNYLLKECICIIIHFKLSYYDDKYFLGIQRRNILRMS